MSKFFTVPTSRRKRKYGDSDLTVPSVKRRTSSKLTTRTQKSTVPRARRDESISGSGSEDELRPKQASDDGGEYSSQSEGEGEDETGAEHRLRLAERYLDNIREEVDQVGFDAEEVEQDLIAERLQDDVVCSNCIIPSNKSRF